jgi:hypothetical protein
MWINRIVIALAVAVALAALVCVAMVGSYSSNGLPVYQGF